jgi:hypothetical protein
MRIRANNDLPWQSHPFFSQNVMAYTLPNIEQMLHTLLFCKFTQKFMISAATIVALGHDDPLQLPIFLDSIELRL